MEIWITGSGGRFRFPILPPSFDITYNSGNDTVDLENIGEVSFIGFPKLITCSFSTFLPSQEYPFVQYKGFPLATEAANIIESLKNDEKPIRFMITPHLNILATIESFKKSVRDGTGDIYVDIAIREYKVIEEKVVNTKVNQYSVGRYEEASRIADQPVPSSVSSKEGDSALTLSKQNFGNASQANNIAKSNNLDNPNNIPAGKDIKMRWWDGTKWEV